MITKSRKKEKEFKLIEVGEVRTRFAPASTGLLHIGSARTALFNYLFAKKNKGTFVLRIEDTDIERSKEQYEKNIIESLDWLGIKWDEGPSKNNSNYIGEYGPYRQSERTALYTKYLKKLLNEGKAYYCFCTHEELEAKRQYKQSRGEPAAYNGKCATLSKEEVEKNLQEKKKYIIRFKVEKKVVEFNDLIRGKVSFDAGLIGDFSISRDINTPLYNFAVVVDDFEMKITHILRGEDLLPNTPKQILLQEALGFTQPQYGHLPLILGPDRSKMSKRHGATSATEYKEIGYLPEALLNFIAFLGWNPGTEREIYSMPSLIKDFSLEKVQKGGAVFNLRRLDYINGFYIRQKSLDKLTELCLPYLIEAEFIKPVFESQERMPNFTGIFGKEIIQKYTICETKEEVNFEYLEKIISLYKERLKKLSEIVEFTDFFFKQELFFEKDLLSWKGIGDSDIKNILETLYKILSEIKDKNWNAKNLEKNLMPEAEKMSSSFGKPGDRGYLLWPLRFALTGKKFSAGPFDIAELLGKEKSLHRISKAKELLE